MAAPFTRQAARELLAAFRVPAALTNALEREGRELRQEHLDLLHAALLEAVLGCARCVLCGAPLAARGVSQARVAAGRGAGPCVVALLRAVLCSADGSQLMRELRLPCAAP